MSVGNLVYIDDGLISLKVENIINNELHCVVVNSGKLGSRKGVNLPDADVDLPALSEKDRADLLWGVEQNIDMVFASFVRKASDVSAVREVIIGAAHSLCSSMS